MTEPPAWTVLVVALAAFALIAWVAWLVTRADRPSPTARQEPPPLAPPAPWRPRESLGERYAAKVTHPCHDTRYKAVGEHGCHNLDCKGMGRPNLCPACGAKPGQPCAVPRKEKERA